MLGVGLGIGFSRGGAAYSVTGSAARVATILDGIQQADYVFSDSVVDVGGTVQSCPSRFGGAPAALTLAGGGASFALSTLGRRTGILRRSATSNFLYNLSFTFKHVFVLAEAPTVPSGGDCGLIRTGAAPLTSAVLYEANGASVWYDNDWTHYRDGVATDAPGTGVCLYEASNAANADAAIAIANWGAENMYPGRIFRVIPCSAVPADAVRSAVRSVMLKTVW